MNVDNILKELSDQGNPSRKKTLMKQGAQDSAIGVPLGFLRTYAKTLGKDHKLGLSLWTTEIVDAQLLAVMLLDGKQIDCDEAVALIQSAQTDPLCDDLIFKCLVEMEKRSELQEILKNSSEDVLTKAYWAFVVDELKVKPVDPALAAMILETCQEDLQDAPNLTQWMMNRALSELGFKHPEYTDACLALGESLGVYKEMKVAKGCTSAYAPAWIEAVLNRK